MLTQINAWTRGLVDSWTSEQVTSLDLSTGELFIAQRSSLILQKSFPLGED